MILELDTTGPKAAIDVTRVRTIRLQCQPGNGNPSSAVVEVKRAFSSRFDSPRVSMPTTTTLTLDGSAITEVDVTDVAWVQLDCTTAQAVTVNVEWATGGEVNGSVVELQVNGDYATASQPITASRKAFVVASPNVAVTSGVFEMKQSIADGFTPVSFAPAASLTLDGSTIAEIDTSPSGLLYAACTTAQSGLRASVFVYLRDEVESDSEYSIACIFAEEGATIASSSNFQWSMGNGDVGDGFGIVVPYGGELIAASLSVQTNSTGTCTVEVYKGADADGTSSATGVSVSLSSGERHNYADYSSSPVTVNAGDWITFKTTANAGGTITGGRVAAWIKIPRL